VFDLLLFKNRQPGPALGIYGACDHMGLSKFRVRQNCKREQKQKERHFQFIQFLELGNAAVAKAEFVVGRAAILQPL
jgi:hypothetical protein